VGAYLPNGAEAVVAFLGAASRGAIWSACGMDGLRPGAPLDRFTELEPVVLLAADGYRNNAQGP
jgi:acetoacetyl-CoA synthetase